MQRFRLASWIIGLIIIALAVINYFSLQLLERILLIIIGVFIIIVF